jgi:amino-acid N-acetyltransferase
MITITPQAEVASVQFRFASSGDLPAIRALLSLYNLPDTDFHHYVNNFIVAIEKEVLIGCIGLEVYQQHGLLRSLAVRRESTGRGIGSQLIERLVSLAHQHGIQKLHLLTTSAENYFVTIGFNKEDRKKAPPEISQTQEFSTLCPASAIYMVCDIQARSFFYDTNLQLIRHHLETNSSYWAIKSKQVMFTHFSVPPFKLFKEHHHLSEQITYVIKGRLYFKIADREYVLSKGDSILIPSHVPHQVYTEKEGAEAVDSWAPINHALIL